jgi:hypothetical protein
MEWIQLWAGITFAAQNGDVEGLLTAAAAGGLHLSDIVPRPGGFSARCAAWHYRKLAALARRRRVRLRIQKRRGLFFCIRPLLRRRGLWAGCLVFLPLLLWLQGFVWFVEPVGLTPGQQARAAVVLWEAGLFPGNAVTQEKLTAGEYALLQSGEFSWASLNFMKGKLVAEAAAAKPVPDIAAGTLHGLRARVSGTVVRTNLVSGTMLVVPGQAVEAGQGLIGTARAERDGTLIFQPASGRSSSGKTSRILPSCCPSNSSQGSRPCIGRCSGTVMLSLCPPCIPSQTRQRPQPSSGTTSQKPLDFLFLFLSKKRHIIIKSPPIWSGPKSRLWPLQGCKVNKLYSRIGLILSFWPAKRTSLSKKTPSTTGSSTPSPPTSANENAAQPRAHLLRPCGDL